jgi:exopolysaccharide biosynthesis WecB/TagA/CpsF family protein
MSDAPALPVKWALGTAFSDIDLAQTLGILAARPAGAPFAYIGIDGAWLRICDSRVMARLMRAVFGIELKLALGSDLTEQLLARIVAPDDPITVIGGDEALAAALRAKYGLRRLEWHSPPFGFTAHPAALQECIDFVAAHPARFVFLACGAPQSEWLGLRICQAGGATGAGLCIGSALLFATGLTARAPAFWQRAGMEWLHRLLVDPGRMSRRLRRDQLPLLRLILKYRADPALRKSQGKPSNP